MEATLERAALLNRILRVSRLTVDNATVVVDPEAQGSTERPPRDKNGLIAAISRKGAGGPCGVQKRHGHAALEGQRVFLHGRARFRAPREPHAE